MKEMVMFAVLPKTGELQSKRDLFWKKAHAIDHVSQCFEPSVWRIARVIIREVPKGKK